MTKNNRAIPILLMLVSIGIFYLPLVQGGYFGGYGDWYLVNYDLIRQSWTQHHAPALRDESAPQSAYGVDMRDSLANPGSPALSPLQWLFLLGVSTDAYIRLIILMYAVIGCVALYVLLLDLGTPPAIAVIFTLLYSESSWVPAHLSMGHSPMVGVALLPLVFLGFHRAVAGGTIWLGAVALAFAGFEGFLHTPVWVVLFGSVYALLWSITERRPRILWTWGWMLGAAFLLGAAKFVPMLAAHTGYVASEGPPPFDLYKLTMSLMAHGQLREWTLQLNWGWWEYSCYVGVVGVVLLVVGSCLAGRRALPWLGLGLFTLVVMLPTPFFQWLRQHAPLWRTERCPSRYVIIAVLAFCVAAAQGMTRVWERAGRLLALRISAALLFAWLTYDLSTQARPWLRTAVALPTPWVSPPQASPGQTTWPGLLGAFLTGIGVTLCVVQTVFRPTRGGAWIVERLRNTAVDAPEPAAAEPNRSAGDRLSA